MTDMVVKGVYPIRMVRKYDSQSRYDSPLGYGWGFTVDKRLYKYADNSIVLRNDCGERQRYLYTGGAYQPPRGLRSTLVETPSGYTLTKLRGARELYDLEGRLTALIDPQGNQLELTYDPAGRLPLNGSSPYSITPDQVAVVAYDYRLIKISERLANGTLTGNEVTLAYHASGRLDKITAIASGDGREVSYVQDTSDSAKNGNLLTVNGLEGIVSTYDYDDLMSGGDPHNITSFQIGADTTPFINTYDTLDRVIQQTRGHGTIDIDYIPEDDRRDVTKTITNPDGTLVLNTLISHYYYDDNGYLTQTQQKLDDGTTATNGTRYRYVYTRNSARTYH